MKTLLALFLLFATTAQAATLTATWTDTSDNENGFRLKRACAPATIETEVATTGANISTVSVTQVANLICTYRVYAYNEVGESGPSNAVTYSTRTIPNAPGSLDLVASQAISEAQKAATALAGRAKARNNKPAIASSKGTTTHLNTALTLAVRAETALGE